MRSNAAIGLAEPIVKVARPAVVCRVTDHRRTDGVEFDMEVKGFSVICSGKQLTLTT